MEKLGPLFRVYVKTNSYKIESFTCKKVIFCMGFIENIRENLKNNENYKFKEHLSSKIGFISNTEKFPLSSSLLFKFNYFKTKRYEIFDNIKDKSIGFFHLSNKKSEFLVKLRDLLICFQSLKLPPLRLIFDVVLSSFQIFPIIKNMILKKGDISNKMSGSDIYLVIDKIECSSITKSKDTLKINWNVSEINMKVFNSLALEINKIIQSLIEQSSYPKKSFIPSKSNIPKEIFHPFSGLEKDLEHKQHIWAGTHGLHELGSLSPTLPSHFLKIKEYENARKNMCNYTHQK